MSEPCLSHAQEKSLWLPAVQRLRLGARIQVWGGRDPGLGHRSWLVGGIQAEWTGAIPHLALRSIVILDKFCTSSLLYSGQTSLLPFSVASHLGINILPHRSRICPSDPCVSSFPLCYSGTESIMTRRNIYNRPAT